MARSGVCLEQRKKSQIRGDMEDSSETLSSLEPSTASWAFTTPQATPKK